jgi:hypothetical protein
MPAPIPANIDDRVGPTDAFLNHHDITDRRGGKRVLTRLQQLLASRHVGPTQSEAGRRFTIDYLKGSVGRGRSCLDIDPSGRGEGFPSEERLDASARYNAARVVVEEAGGPRLPGGTSTDLLILSCVEDTSFSELASRGGISAEVIKSWISQLLTVLAAHYAAVDRISGKSTTVYTYEGAIARFEPEVK